MLFNFFINILLGKNMALEILKKGTSENFLLRQIIRKNFTSKYKDSFIGVLWSFLNPLIEMALLTAIFSTVFARSIENFPVYFLTGRIVVNFFNNGTKMAMKSIKSNRSIFNKIFVPRYIFALGGICSEFLNFLMSVIVLIAIMFLTQAPFYPMALLSIIPIMKITREIINVVNIKLVDGNCPSITKVLNWAMIPYTGFNSIYPLIG